MAYDKVVDSGVLDGKLTAIADAIRGKTGGTDALTLEQMAAAIGGISGGGSGGGMQMASGEYVNAAGGGFAIDISNIGFVPDIALVTLDDVNTEYDSPITKAWALFNIPLFAEYLGLLPSANLSDSATSFGINFSGNKGQNVQQNAAKTTNFVGTNRSNVFSINVAGRSSQFPIIAGAYKWECYKIWEDE